MVMPDVGCFAAFAHFLTDLMVNVKQEI